MQARNHNPDDARVLKEEFVALRNAFSHGWKNKRTKILFQLSWRKKVHLIFSIDQLKILKTIHFDQAIIQLGA